MHVRSHYEHRNGFRPIVCARKGRLYFARSPMDGPVFPTRDGAVQWCVDIMEENHLRMGPFAIAMVEPYSGPVSVMELVD